jgi:hypothetical protein
VRVAARKTSWIASLVHGFATLWLNRALPAELGEDPQTAARAVARFLFREP